MKRILIMIVGFAFVISAHASARAGGTVAGKTVEYSSGGVILKGFLASDDGIKGKRPGVLVVHEWWGLNDYARKRANMLAELGYTALAVDMYGEGKTATHPDDAGKFSSAVMKDFPVAKERFLAALEFLRKQKTVDPDRIAAIGYCFGGGVVLNMARHGVDLKGVASFHGSLAVVKPEAPVAVKAAVRVYNGADDTFVPAEAIEGLKREMAEKKVYFKFMNLPGAVHSFTNPDATKMGEKFGLPLAYNAAADRASWADLQAFFKEIFKK